MEQVLMNLVVNARDAMPDGGDLTIATENVTLGVEEAGQYADATAGPYVMLSVRDTGIGMDEATKARVFEPFFTTKGLGEGTGLGLATVYGIVKQFGGSIAVESAPGAGSTFRVLLPSADVAVESPTPTPTPAVRAPGRAVAPGGSDSGKYARGTVLLVEDNSAVRGATRKVLERHGHAVIEAENGEAALRILEDASQPVDVVVSDVVMPVLGGLQLIRRLEVLRPGTRVVLMSGFTADAMVNRGSLPAGITFLEKPFQAEALLGAVEEMLRVAPSASRLAASAEMPPLSGSPVVAIIDDTELNRVLGAVLLDDTYRVITHEGGPEAVQVMAEARPHVILLDIEMPHLDGFELLRELRAHPMLRRTRIVAFTSRDSADDRRAYVAAGFDGFLGKPISDRDAFRHVVAGEVRIAALTE
jgi:CheY-like chemotaxis protein